MLFARNRNFLSTENTPKIHIKSINQTNVLNSDNKLQMKKYTKDP